MYLVQLLLPVYDDKGNHFAAEQFDAVRRTLTDRFGGVTAYFRSPAAGLWKEEHDTLSSDQVVMLEVIAPELEKEWWAHYRTELERQFSQKQLLVWASEITKL